MRPPAPRGAPARPLAPSPPGVGAGSRRATALCAHAPPIAAKAPNGFGRAVGGVRLGRRPAATAPASACRRRDALAEGRVLREIRKSNAVLYNTVVVQAQRIEVKADRIVLTYTAAQKIGPTFDKYRPVLEASATRLAGRKMTVVADTSAAEAAAPGGEAKAGEAKAATDRKSALKEEALADAGVQALLEVFPAEIRDVEEM